MDPEDVETSKPASLRDVFSQSSESEKASVVW